MDRVLRIRNVVADLGNRDWWFSNVDSFYYFLSLALLYETTNSNYYYSSRSLLTQSFSRNFIFSHLVSLFSNDCKKKSANLWSQCGLFRKFVFRFHFLYSALRARDKMRETQGERASELVPDLRAVGSPFRLFLGNIDEYGVSELRNGRIVDSC